MVFVSAVVLKKTRGAEELKHDPAALKIEGTKMSKPKYKLVERFQFIEARYNRFLKNKSMLKGNPMASFIAMTDLDRTYEGETKPQKNIVLCDRCNEDIKDSHFIMLENMFCYHRECIKDELPPKFKKEVFSGNANVIVVDFSKKG